MSSLATVPTIGTALMRRSLEITCRVAAISGGLLIVALAIITVVSILGRWVASVPVLSDMTMLAWVGPITGDYELVEMGTAIAVFLFLPYCHFRSGHVTVDLLVMNAPPVVQRLLAVVAEMLFLVVAGLMTWRLYHGLLDKRRYMETSMLLDIPLWWGYVGGVAGFALLTLVCLYRALDALTDKQQYPNSTHSHSSPTQENSVQGDL
ncbi:MULTISPECIES: TRAP transporter small permease [unclassified Halomonas]|uniref:TRAP transporter small permease n=1 Tax=unclassified Halomonas TaxID=2609666 RepID=UPI0006DB9E70|nr:MULTISPECIES: TRAP transporter small permease [unclassified Halomonas]KPQ30884.1 MAG: TRAP-type C4-dicarboxylate transport system, small permease component [Halomonas sp. HL-93]SBR52776.1 TRAP-type C4-dicarboxylate transport system, small permease component [Halomonas sp. HL-93]SNY97830.1 TRAP-type C4-dicarboxylate transport system, small permease component [Halomonas sp. hl-4]